MEGQKQIVGILLDSELVITRTIAWSDQNLLKTILKENEVSLIKLHGTDLLLRS
jgi:hypothetical protein